MRDIFTDLTAVADKFEVEGLPPDSMVSFHIFFHVTSPCHFLKTSVIILLYLKHIL